MSTPITPAVGRGATAITKRWYELAAEQTIGDPEAFGLMFAEKCLTAALTDPDDPDSLARTLFALQMCTLDTTLDAETAFRMWFDMPEEVRGHWRQVAEGLRMMLVGSGS